MLIVAIIVIIIFSVYFRLFQTNNASFTTNQCEKMTKCSSSLWCRDSNPRPSKNESSPITTRPGLPPLGPIFLLLTLSRLTDVQISKLDVVKGIKKVNLTTPFPLTSGLSKICFLKNEDVNILNSVSHHRQRQRQQQQTTCEW